MNKKDYSDFINWCLTNDKKATVFTTRELARGNNDAKWLKPINESLDTKIKSDNGKIKIKLNNKIRSIEDLIIDGNHQSFENYIDELDIYQHTDGHIYINNLNAKYVEINFSQIESILVRVKINNSNIHALRIIRDEMINFRYEIDIVNTNIGNLAVNSDAIRDFSMQSGCLLNMDCPRPGENNPFSGNVNFKNVFFQTKRMEYFLRGAQGYRNMRHHMVSLENSQMGNLFHTLQLQVEKYDDDKSTNFVSNLYWLFSDYGRSISRPVGWIFGAIFLTFIISFFTNGSALSHSESFYTGWRQLLVGDGTKENLARSFILAIQSSVNVLGFFGIKGLLVPKGLFFAIWTLLQSFLTVIWIALVVFAIRRRFKIQ